MKERVLYLLKVYLATVAIFLLAKIGFILFNGAGHDVGIIEILSVLRHGMTLDLSTALYLLVVPFLLTIVVIWTDINRWVLRIYYTIIALALALTFVADTCIYRFWGTKLDASYLQYLEQPEGITQSVSWPYLFMVVIALTGGTIIIFLLFDKIKKPTENRGSVKRRLAETIVYLLCIPCIVIGVRGGIGESTTNTGQAYFSQNQFLNHAAVNPLFSFFYSVNHQMEELDSYQFLSEEACSELTDGVYTTESIDNDTLLNTPRPNVLVILMESAGEQFANAMPRLQHLKKEGVSFSNCYANSWRTDRGTVCTLSGYPSFPTLSVMKIQDKSETLPGIAHSLQEEEYHTTYLYGGDINFTNMRSYLIATGWERLISMNNYSIEEQRSSRWGVRDDITFKTLEELIKTQEGSAFLIGYSTLSSHEPWDVPIRRLNDKVQNAFAYLDDCLCDFIDRLRKTPSWHNLLIVITADHGINYQDVTPSTPLRKNHIPMLWVGGAVKEPRRIETLCNQSDMVATLLGQMRLSHHDFTFSRDICSKTYRHPTAVHNYSRAQWITDSTGQQLYDFDTEQAIIDESTDGEALLRLNKAILQITHQDLKNR
ncbi:MAG: sulfatase-like hydrolase/transferase [Prevotella sp.]|nr:sulfatase-like hydrolase/transferase [Prevotella sp.]